MKRFLLFLIVAAVVPFNTVSCAPKVESGNRILHIISEYRNKDGFEVVRIGAMGTSLAKAAVNIAVSSEDDPEMKALMNMVRDVKKMAIVDYEDCSQSVRDEFNAKVSKALDGAELLMEVHDEDDSFRIFGIPSKDGSALQDLIMFSPDDGNLICITGSVKTEL